MGFYLWIDEELAWAQGTYEYRPLGSAVISSSDLFRRRDFKLRQHWELPPSARYAGQFASLGHLNLELLKLRRLRLENPTGYFLGGIMSHNRATRSS